MQCVGLARTAAIGPLGWQAACIPIPFKTAPSTVELVQGPPSSQTLATDLSHLRVAPFYQPQSVAAFSKALTRADDRVEPLDSASVWRTVFPQRDPDAEVSGDEFLEEEQRSRLKTLGVRFLVILGPATTTTVNSSEFPGIHFLGKWDKSTTQGLTLVDLAEAGSQDRLSPRVDGKSGATWVPALLADRIPEGLWKIVVVSESGPDLGQ